MAAPEPKPEPKPATPEPEPAKTEDRLERVEAEQREQRGLLNTILEKVSGTAPEAPKGAQNVTETRLERSTIIADQVKQAVKDVGAEQEAERLRAEHDAEHARLRIPAAKPEPEHQPRERQGGAKAKWQKIMFGGDK